MFFCSSNSFSSQLLGSCRLAAKLLWPTGRTSPPARVCALKPAHGNDAAIFCVRPVLYFSDTAKSLRVAQAQHKSDIKIFYHYQEGFSTNFHIFIHKNHARPISLRQRMCFFLQKAGKKGALPGRLSAPKLPLQSSYAVIRQRTNVFASNPFCIKGISGSSAQGHSY